MIKICKKISWIEPKGSRDQLIFGVAIAAANDGDSNIFIRRNRTVVELSLIHI